MQRIRDDIARRDGARSVVLSHAFVVNVPRSPARPASEASDVERDITAGGLDLVSVDVFGGADYVALGHIHGRSTLTPAIRYSGAPLHYSFGEADKPRGAWLVDLDAAGLDTVEWVDLPVPRPLSILTGELHELLADPALSAAEGDFVSVVLTDQVRPIDGMRRIQSRFPYAVQLTHQPAVVAERAGGQLCRTTARAIRQRGDRRIPRVRAQRGGSERRRERADRRDHRRAGRPGVDRVRINRLTIAGFGPYKTAQHIDFDAFSDDGIFLITGNTGAGKSSILDAICFALYAGVPRYEGTQQQLRSDYCEPGDPTYVELWFSTGGQQYRVRRSPDYERPKKNGVGTTKSPAAAEALRAGRRRVR